MKKLLILTILITLLILPYSSAYLVNIKVKDKLDNLVPYSELKIECTNYTKLTKTDKFGSFTTEIDRFPCMISAKHKRDVGFIRVESINNNMDVILDKKLLKTKIFYYILFLTIILILIFLGYKFKKRLKTSKFNNIMRILNEKEKIIINEILKQKGKTTQAKLYHITKIPKVSLSRHIKSLENKKIIQTERFGKLKKIKFSKWFKK